MSVEVKGSIRARCIYYMPRLDNGSEVRDLLLIVLLNAKGVDVGSAVPAVQKRIVPSQDQGFPDGPFVLAAWIYTIYKTITGQRLENCKQGTYFAYYTS